MQESAGRCSGLHRRRTKQVSFVLEFKKSHAAYVPRMHLLKPWRCRTSTWFPCRRVFWLLWNSRLCNVTYITSLMYFSSPPQTPLQLPFWFPCLVWFALWSLTPDLLHSLGNHFIWFFFILIIVYCITFIFWPSWLLIHQYIHCLLSQVMWFLIFHMHVFCCPGHFTSVKDLI